MKTNLDQSFCSGYVSYKQGKIPSNGDFLGAVGVHTDDPLGMCISLFQWRGVGVVHCERLRIYLNKTSHPRSSTVMY